MKNPQLKLDNQLCFRLYTASRLVTQVYEPFFRPVGITYTQYLVLMVLWEEDRQPVTTIGKRLQLGINTVSPLIKRMEGLDLVARCSGEDDKRQQFVYLTERGKLLEDEMKGIPDSLANALEAEGLVVEKLKPLYPLLDYLINNLKKL